MSVALLLVFFAGLMLVASWREIKASFGSATEPVPESAQESP